MKPLLNRLLSGRFGRNIAFMTGATVIGHGLFLVASPLLTRVFDPAAFALLSILMTIQALALAAVSGKIEWSVLTAKNRGRAAALVKASLVITIAVTALLTIGMVWHADYLAKALGLGPDIKFLLLILPVSILAASVQMILQSWCVITGELRPIALSKLIQSALFVGIALAGGVITGAGAWLATGFTLSHVLAGIVLIALLVEVFKIFSDQNWSYILAVTCNSRKEIAASLGSSILHRLAFYLPFLMIWALYDETILGWFAFVFRMGTAPLSFLSGALAKSFWAEATDLAKSDPPALRRLFLRTLQVLGLAGAAFAIICLTAPFYFGFIFGEKWAGAGGIMAAMTPMLFSLLVFSSTNHLIVYRRQHWQLWCDALSIILFGGVFWVMASVGYSIVLVLSVSSFAFLISYSLRFYLHLLANKRWTKENQK